MIRSRDGALRMYIYRKENLVSIIQIDSGVETKGTVSIMLFF